MIERNEEYVERIVGFLKRHHEWTHSTLHPCICIRCGGGYVAPGSDPHPGPEHAKQQLCLACWRSAVKKAMAKAEPPQCPAKEIA